MNLELFLRGKPCSNWLTEASGGAAGLQRVLLHNQVKMRNTRVFVFKRVND